MQGILFYITSNLLCSPSFSQVLIHSYPLRLILFCRASLSHLPIQFSSPQWTIVQSDSSAFWSLQLHSALFTLIQSGTYLFLYVYSHSALFTLVQ